MGGGDTDHIAGRGHESAGCDSPCLGQITSRFAPIKASWRRRSGSNGLVGLRGRAEMGRGRPYPLGCFGRSRVTDDLKTYVSQTGYMEGSILGLVISSVGGWKKIPIHAKESDMFRGASDLSGQAPAYDCQSQSYADKA